MLHFWGDSWTLQLLRHVLSRERLRIGIASWREHAEEGAQNSTKEHNVGTGDLRYWVDSHAIYNCMKIIRILEVCYRSRIAIWQQDFRIIGPGRMSLIVKMKVLCAGWSSG